jgi:hypothetical protein
MYRRGLLAILVTVGISYHAGQGAVGTSSGCQDPVDSAEAGVFRLAPLVITNIAKKHPRFGATLANQNGIGFHAGRYKVRWAPIPLRASDIVYFLHRGEHAEFFAHYNERVKEINKQVEAGVASLILYNIDVSQRPSNVVALNLTVVQGSDIDPPAASLSVTVRRVNRSHDFIADPKDTTWLIR